MLLKYKHLLFFLIIPCLLLTSCNNEDEMEMEEVITYDYISFTFDGTEYMGLTPLFSDVISDMSSYSGEKVLELRGAHSDVELQFYIHQNLWEEGTYNLLEDEFSFFNSSNIKLAMFITGSGDFHADVTSGSLTITEFNTEDRVLNATFEFSYILDDWDGNVEGPFEVTNGSINVPLDNEYFD